ncbi:MAG: hypothetical protein NE327_03485 [Lentisphaeraceae bacterium]|nr:hypothetical protein [Lentisphaeraceae bacterium]
MKLLIIPIFILFVACQSNELSTLTYDYNWSQFKKPLGLNGVYKDTEVEARFKELFSPFGLALSYKVKNKKLIVSGLESDLKAFEFITINLLRLQPEFEIKGSIYSSVTKQKVSFDTRVQPFQKKNISFSSTNGRDPKFMATIDLQYRAFDSKAQIHFSIRDLENKKDGSFSSELSYSAIFDNRTTKESYLRLKDDQGDLSCLLESSLSAEWKFKNSHFFKNIPQIHRLKNGRVITSVYTFSFLEDINGKVEDYLISMGMPFGEQDRIVSSKSQKIILLYSSEENSKRLLELFRPLCCFDSYEVEMEGKINNSEGVKGEFKIPVLMGSSSSLSVNKNSSLSLLLNYKMAVDATPIMIGGNYHYSNEINSEDDVYIVKIFESGLKLGEDKNLKLQEGHLLKLQVINQSIK